MEYPKKPGLGGTGQEKWQTSERVYKNEYNSTYIQSQEIIEQKIQGQTSNVRIDCPECSGSQKNTLSVNADSGLYYCFRCGIKGRLKKGSEKKPLRDWLWDNAHMCTYHPYLDKKKVKSYGLKRLAKGPLVIPLCQHGQISSLQFIDAEGGKKLLSKTKGGFKKGSYFTISGDDSIIYVCEGYATSASVHDATGCTTIMAVDAGNLVPVTENLKRQYPDRQFIFCADNDKNGKGLKEALRAASLVNGKVAMPEKVSQDFNDVYLEQGVEAVRKQLSKSEESIKCFNPLTKAREIIPRVAYPWSVLPPDLAESLQALARSCATDADSLPGIAMAMTAAVTGRNLAITPKQEWNEPVVLWFIDIRDSGEGKTPPMWLLAGVLKKNQQDEHDRYEQELEEWEDAPKKDRGKPPNPPRGYYITDLTLEGLRTDLERHPTGGIVILLNEASALISGQNQYKQKGTDRESWLALHDGQPARIVRATKKYLISGARVQVVGGIQPRIFQRVFGGDDSQYLEDGTVYRCLFTLSPPSHHDLTSASWHEYYKQTWEDILNRALSWSKSVDDTHRIHLTQEAQDLFYRWRNQLHSQRMALPKEVRGFLPKTYGYALRLAAVIECLHCFHKDESPRTMLDAQGIQRGIDTAMYYLGQAVDAVRLLAGGGQDIDPIKTKIFDALRDNGPMTASDINSVVFKRNLPADQIKAALDALMDSGEIEAVKEGTDGRPRTLFRLIRNKIREGKPQEPPDIIDFSFNSLNSSQCTGEVVEDEVEI